MNKKVIYIILSEKALKTDEIHLNLKKEGE